MTLPRPVTAHLSFDAAIFDMDGVVTQTAAVHSSAWKRTFDEYLLGRHSRFGEPFEEFTHEHDYRRYVDGRPRYRGVEAFLASRGIVIPFGLPSDPAGADTVCGLGNRKNSVFNEIIQSEGVAVFPSTLRLIEEMVEQGIRVGLATSSRNAEIILLASGTKRFFETVVDGLVSETMGLAGKPAPDIFLTACLNLGAEPLRSIVVEDAASGVRAGAQGGFGLVIGVAREGNAAELEEQGADVVVTDLVETSVGQIHQRILTKSSKRC